MRVFGVSRDSHWSHRAWKDVLDADVPLLSDWNGALASNFGAARVWRWMEGVPRRSTFLVGEDGTVLGSWRYEDSEVPDFDAPLARAGIAGLAAALYLGAGLLATSPAVFQTDRFLGYGEPREARHARRPPPDRLRALASRQLARGAEPWLDPYSFQPESQPRINFAGWPFAALYGPLQALLGTVAGWNVFVLLTYVGAGGLTALWLRALGLGLGPALVGGLAFALAPYRVAQSTGHLLGPISMLLPLALFAVERRLVAHRRGARVDPALGPGALRARRDPVRARLRARAAPALARCDRGGRRSGGRGDRLVALTRDTVERPYAEVERYSASASDFLSRDPGEFERFVYLGWLLPLLAVLGLGCLCFRNTISSGRGLALALGLGALVPAPPRARFESPGYGVIWRHTPLHATRVPERLLPIACLCLAALAGVAIACVSETQARARLVAALAAVAVAADLWVPLYDPLVADEGNAVYARVAAAPPGRLLELPTLPPDAYAGSVYLYYAMQAPRSGRSAMPPRRPRRPIAPPGGASAHASWESVSSSRIETASRNRRGLHQNDEFRSARVSRV